MAIGIVLDTNVLVHPNNPDVYCFETCTNLLNHLINSEEDYIYVDVDFSMDESLNRSLIGQEYLEHLNVGDLGYTCLLQLLANDRVEFISISVRNQMIRKRIYLLPIIQPDKRFVSLTYNSGNRILISEDFTDFTQALRNEIESSIGIEIIQAYQIFQP